MLKSNKYALSDGEDDILTHHGAALSTLDDFEDEIVKDDDGRMYVLCLFRHLEGNFGILLHSIISYSA
jgi:hypothetical protein